MPSKYVYVIGLDRESSKIWESIPKGERSKTVQEMLKKNAFEIHSKKEKNISDELRNISDKDG